MAALSFPASPVDGQIFDTFIYNATKGVWQRNEWAAVSGGTQTSYTLADGSNWVAHTFTSSGTLTVTKTGLIDVMCVAPGAGASERYGRWGLGGGGDVRWGIKSLTETGDYTVAVGSPTSIEAPSGLPVYISGPGESGRAYEHNINMSKHGSGGGGGPRGLADGGGTYYGGGQGGLYYGLTNHAGIELDYSGTVHEYGRGGDNSTAGNTGYGQGSCINYVGGLGGIVIARYRV